jgi:hypothetical protein
MDQVETWFSILTRQAIRRGSFESVRALTAAIERFSREWNAGTTPFTWVKTADEIIAKAIRKTQADTGAGHWSDAEASGAPKRCHEHGCQIPRRPSGRLPDRASVVGPGRESTMDVPSPRSRHHPRPQPPLGRLKAEPG